MVRYIHETDFLESFDNITGDCYAVCSRASPELSEIDYGNVELLIGLFKTAG